MSIQDMINQLCDHHPDVESVERIPQNKRKGFFEAIDYHVHLNTCEEIPSEFEKIAKSFMQPVDPKHECKKRMRSSSSFWHVEGCEYSFEEEIGVLQFIPNQKEKARYNPAPKIPAIRLITVFIRPSKKTINTLDASILSRY